MQDGASEGNEGHSRARHPHPELESLLLRTDPRLSPRRSAAPAGRGPRAALPPALTDCKQHFHVLYGELVSKLDRVQWRKKGWMSSSGATVKQRVNSCWNQN